MVPCMTLKVMHGRRFTDDLPKIDFVIKSPGYDPEGHAQVKILLKCLV